MIWTVAPSKESAKEPTIPPIPAAAVNGQKKPARDAASHCAPTVDRLSKCMNNQAAIPMNTAPAAVAVNPSAVIPPEVPAGTVRPVAIERGSVLLSPPTSVAQVSAFTVAITPMNITHHTGLGFSANNTHSSPPRLRLPQPGLRPVSRFWHNRSPQRIFFSSSTWTTVSM